MSDTINKLVKKYVLWPELENDAKKNIHFGKTTMAEFSEHIRDTLNDSKRVDAEIALFYLTNEKLSTSRLETQDVLGPDEIKTYQDYQQLLNTQSKDLIAYIVLCSMVEARHARPFKKLEETWYSFLGNTDPNNKYSIFVSNAQGKNSESIKTIQSHPQGPHFLSNFFGRYYDKLSSPEKFPEFINFLCDIKHDVVKTIENTHRRSDGYYHVANDLLTTTFKDYSVENSLEFLKVIFSVNQFKKYYGGKSWADIANHGLSFVKGEINSEVFIDQAFSLEHNTGNMFNKKIIFSEPNSVYTSVYIDKTYGIAGNGSLSANDILLNAQHLGGLGKLFNLEKIYRRIKNTDLNQLYEELTIDGKIGERTSEDFTKEMGIIIRTTEKLIELLRPTKEVINAVHPELLEDEAVDYLDLKKILQKVGEKKCTPTNDLPLFLRRQITSEDGIFDLWNYMFNEKFNPNFEKEVKKDFSLSSYDVAQLPDTAFNKETIGGKAYSLANMNRLGIPVPKAMVFGTDCCHAYYQHREQFNREITTKLTGLEKYLKNEEGNPILCSVRSGSAVSMPGMMDTVLNVGIDSSNYQYFCETLGKKVTDSCATKFMELFCSSRLNEKVKFKGTLQQKLDKFKEILEWNDIPHNPDTLFPLNQTQQITESLTAVFNSWNSPRAKAFRNHKGISHNLGTAAIVQQMVFGNLNDHSCTGVIFSRDCLTGENKLVGEFLPKAQGEDVVSGSHTPFPIDKFQSFNSKAYEQLEGVAKQLEKQTGQVQDIEFTVENDKLYILQHRQAVCSPMANLELVKDNSLTDSSFSIEPNMLQTRYSVDTKESPAAQGLPANSGVIQGIVVRSEKDMVKFQEIYNQHTVKNPNFGWIFYAPETSPNHMPIMNKTDAFVTTEGGFTSHAAIIARSLNKPCIVGTGEKFKAGELLTLDATNGKIWKGQQTLVENHTFTNVVAQHVLDTNNVDLAAIDDMQPIINEINNKNRLWILDLSEAKTVNERPVKQSAFLNIGQKVAMILSANQRNTQKLRMG